MNQTSTIVKTLCLLLFPAVMWGQSDGDYRTAATGNWNNTATWERYNGTSWVAPAPSAPVSADGAITILNGHTVTITAAVTADQITVDAGGTLNNNQAAANLTLNDDVPAGVDLLVNGTFNLGSITVANTLTAAGVSPSVQVNGIMNWRNGTLNVATTIGGTGTLNLSENFAKFLNTTLTNNGIFNWQTGASSGGFGISNGASIVNNGTINEQFSSNNRGIAMNGGGTATFINNGILNKTTTFLMEIYGSVTLTNTGTIKGIGTLQCDSPPVNSGILAPGNSPGLLIASNNLVSTENPSIWLEIVDGSGVGIGHDKINFNTAGNVDVSGTTLIVEASTSAPIQSYTILEKIGGGVFTGNFASVLIPLNYSITYNPGTSTSIVVTKLGSTLPAVWGSFNALTRNNQVNLKWETLQESNVADFTVEYSVNGRDYLPLTTVAAAGNSNSIQTYSYVHTMPDMQKNNFYRIRQTDLDGKSAFSAVRTAKFTKGQVVAVTANPNPVRDRLQLQVQSENIRVVLSDLAGRTIQSLQTQPGYHEINMSQLAPGIYNLAVFNNNNLLETQKIVKQ